MTLRRKLFRTLTALALVGLLVISVTGFAVYQWSSTEETLQRHYARSLLLREVQSLGFRAVKEVPDAVAGEDPVEARAVFDATVEPANEAFAQWADLADDATEREEVERVREAFNRLIDDARSIFDLVDAGQIAEAGAQVEITEDNDFLPFETLVEQAIASDRAKREVLREQAADARGAATTALVVASLGVLCLGLLLAAFLSGDLFRPLRDLRRSLDRLADGDADVRLDTARKDELGEVATSFNALAASMEHQVRRTADVQPDHDANRLALLRVADRLRAGARTLADDVHADSADDAAALAAQA